MGGGYGGLANAEILDVDCPEFFLWVGTSALDYFQSLLEIPGRHSAR